MRSRCSAIVLALAALAACGDDVDPSCDSTVTYQTVGEPYLANWCLGCHSVDVPPGMRQQAPVGMNFDTVDEVRAQLISLESVTLQQTMPPEGGPADAERTLWMQWLSCGAP